MFSYFVYRPAILGWLEVPLSFRKPNGSVDHSLFGAFQVLDSTVAVRLSSDCALANVTAKSTRTETTKLRFTILDSAHEWFAPK